MAKLESIFLKCYKNQPYLVRKKAEYLLRFSLVVLLICLVGIVLRSGLNELLFYTISFVSFVGVVWFLTRGNLNLAVWIVTIMVSVDIFFDTLQFDPITYERIVETIMESFLSYILIGFVAINRRQIIYTISSNTGLTVFHIIMIIYFGYANSPLPSSANRYFIGGVIAVLLVGFLTLAIVRIHEEAVTIVEQQKELLSSDNKQLEELVSTRTYELEVMNQKLEKVNQELITLAMYDQLTGIPNRRKVLHEAEQIVAKSIYQRTPVSIAMLDIDHFKHINDTYGHLTGDLVLKKLADVLMSSLQPADIVGRIGGEEFLIILDNKTIGSAMDIMNELKSTVADLPIHLPTHLSNGHLLYFTVSIGLSELTDGESLEELIHQADMALYLSKANGRNQVTMYADLDKL
jgi:diguanylate cyclase (GGDEF)-like protein